jgi:hypothetical protein
MQPENLSTCELVTLSGGSGIRTHVGVTQTCFQDMRLQPLGHPSRRKDFTMFFYMAHVPELLINYSKFAVFSQSATIKSYGHANYFP